MHNFFKSLFAFVILVQSCAPVLTRDQAQTRNAQWSVRQVTTGVVWKYCHFDSLFNSRQSVTVLDVDLKDVSGRVEYLDSGFFKTSTRAQEAGAVAAVNGSFFNTKRGGSVVFFQYDGAVITPSHDAPRAYRDNAGFAIDRSGKSFYHPQASVRVDRDGRLCDGTLLRTTPSLGRRHGHPGAGEI